MKRLYKHFSISIVLSAMGLWCLPLGGKGLGDGRSSLWPDHTYYVLSPSSCKSYISKTSTKCTVDFNTRNCSIVFRKKWVVTRGQHCLLIGLNFGTTNGPSVRQNQLCFGSWLSLGMPVVVCADSVSLGSYQMTLVPGLLTGGVLLSETSTLLICCLCPAYVP